MLEYPAAHNYRYTTDRALSQQLDWVRRELDTVDCGRPRDPRVAGSVRAAVADRDGEHRSRERRGVERANCSSPNHGQDPRIFDLQ